LTNLFFTLLTPFFAYFHKTGSLPILKRKPELDLVNLWWKMEKRLAIFLESGVICVKTRKHFFMLFMPFLGQLGTPKWTQKGTQRPISGRNVWPNVRAKKLAPNQIIRSILLGEMVQNNQKTVFLCCFWPFWGHFGTVKWTQKGTQRPASRGDV
jgi:hypothetical protein